MTSFDVKRTSLHKIVRYNDRGSTALFSAWNIHDFTPFNDFFEWSRNMYWCFMIKPTHALLKFSECHDQFDK